MTEEVANGIAIEAEEEPRPVSNRSGARLGYTFNRYRLRLFEVYKNNKRAANTATLLFQYLLALLTLVLPTEEAVAVAYGSVSVFNGLLLALQPFYFQPQPVLINEGLFDIVFLVNLLFFSPVANGNEEARIMLYVALASAVVAVAAFAISYYITFPTVTDFKRVQFGGPRARAKQYATTNGILMFVGFVLTDCADFIILAVQVGLLGIAVDTKIVLFVLFLLMNPLISQLGAYTAIRVQDEQDFSLAPYNENDEVVEAYLKREKELKERLARVLAQEARSERKNVALTGVLAIIVFPIILTVVFALRGDSQALIIMGLLPLATALPIWLLWKMMGIPWDKYMLVNDAWRTLLPRIIVVSWAIAMIVLSGPDLLIVTLTLLLYSLVPLFVYFVEQFVRRTRLECTYRQLGVFDDAGLRRLFRSRMQDKFRFLYDPPDAYKAQFLSRLCRDSSAFHPVKRFERTLSAAWNPKEEGISKPLGAVLEALTNVLTRSYILDLSTFKLAGEEYESIKERISEIVPKMQQAYVNSREKHRDPALEAHWYCWSESLLRLGIDNEIKLWPIVQEAQTADVSSLEFYNCKDLSITADGLNAVLANKGRRLKALNFRNATFTHSLEEVFGDVEWFVSSSLKSLVLESIHLNDRLGARIVCQLPWQLTYLSLSRCKIRQRTARELADYVANPSCALETLDLANNSIKDGSGQAFAQALVSNRTITTLILHGNLLKDGTGEIFGRVLREGPKLKDLWLGANRIEEVGARAIGAALAKNKDLEFLSLNGNEHLNDHGVVAIGQALKTNKVLHTLWLSNTATGDEAVEAIAGGLAENNSLTNLYMNINEIKDQGVVALGNSLKTNSALSTLEMKQNEIGDNSAVSIGLALELNATLTTLNLDNNHISDKGMVAIGAGLKQNETLTFLCLRKNRCSEEGAIALAEALVENSSLESLDLKSNQIPDSAAGHLAGAIRQNTSVTYLHLGYNRMGDEGILQLGEAMVENSTIETLFVYTRALSPEALEQLEKRDPRISLHKFK